MTDVSSMISQFYRAAVQRADNWQNRLDRTTNWAIVTNAGVISFAFNSRQTLHLILLFMIVLDWLFLIMEARRFQKYDLWIHRIHLLHEHIFDRLFRRQSRTGEDEELREYVAELDLDLSHDLPRTSLVDAIGDRIRQTYGYIFILTIGAWLLKLVIHPVMAPSFAEFVQRAGIGAIDGVVLLSAVAAVAIVAVMLVLQTPSTEIVEWEEEPSPLRRLFRLEWFPTPPE